VALRGGLEKAMGFIKYPIFIGLLIGGIRRLNGNDRYVLKKSAESAFVLFDSVTLIKGYRTLQKKNPPFMSTLETNSHPMPFLRIYGNGIA
jgi:hypothetical protein